ncbi:MAG TPA: glycosyltransferase [Acidimicrobiales bacterium]|jgi:glycosyltransferase involved in cell wall biosynthesis
MSSDDLVMVAPYPRREATARLPSGVAAYTERLTTALADEGLKVRVMAPEEDDEPVVTRVSRGVTVQRCFRRGPAAYPAAASAASRAKAPIVHLQFETFLFGGPTSIPGLAPALASLRGRRRGPVVTMHQVVDPAAVDRSFTEVHRVRVPHRVARAGLSGLQRTVQALSAATVVHEKAFSRILPDAVVVPHGIDNAGPGLHRRPVRGLEPESDRLTALCFGFLSPYKGLETVLEAAALVTDSVELVIAGGPHPRLEGYDSYADDLCRRYGDTARFVGYVREEDVEACFRSADVLLLPYPAPFATSGPFAQALGFGTPILCSAALADCLDAPLELVAQPRPEGWARKLLQLASDRQELERLGAATAELSAGRSWGEVARRHIELYEEVINARRTAGRRLWPGKPGG